MMNLVFPYNEKIEEQIKQIKHLLHLSMNGVASEGMSSLGYRLNYGVALNRIKELASRFPSDRMLALQLWQSDCREMMIMATLIYPHSMEYSADFDRFVAECKNVELTEQLCRNLLSQLPISETFIAEILSKESLYAHSLAYVLATSLIIKNDGKVNFLNVLKSAMQDDVYSEQYVLYSAVARFLRVWARYDKDEVSAFINAFDVQKGVGVKAVIEDVNTVLLYD